MVEVRRGVQSAVGAVEQMLLAVEIGGSLASGAAGVSVFLAHAACWLSEDPLKVSAARLARASSRMIAAGPAMPSLMHGYVGVAWTATYLSTLLPNHFAAVGLAQVDEHLLSIVSRTSEGGVEFDLSSGLSGIGIYALARLDSQSGRDLLCEVLLRLEREGHRDDAGIFWTTPLYRQSRSLRQRFPAGVINLGIAHGLPGVVGFLSQATDVPWLREFAGGMLEDATTTLLSFRRGDDCASRYPPFVGNEGVGWSATQDAESVGWCYGDLGILSVLCAIPETFRSDQLRSEIATLASRAIRASRKWLASPVNCGLCHGTAAVLALACHCALLLPNTDVSPGPLLDVSHSHRGPFSSLARVAERSVRLGFSEIGSLGLLEGLAGCGLALLLSVDPRSAGWLRVMALTPSIIEPT
jgi:lantibiotic biosynthesis protein